MDTHVAGQNCAFLQEDGTGLPDFALARVNLLFQEVYGYLPHHNNRLHLDERAEDDAVWQHHWCQYATHSVS